jgi:hypothetical protein
MARIGMAGGEGGSTVTDGMTIPGSAPALDTTIVHGGAYSWKWQVTANPGSFGSFAFTGVLGRTYYYRLYVNVATFPTTEDLGIMSFDNVNDVSLVAIGINTSHQAYLFDLINGAQVGSVCPEVMVTNRWYMFDLACRVSASTNDDYAEARMNGVSFASSSSLNLGADVLKFIFMLGLTTSGSNDTFTFYQDDLALNDDQGSVNNTWCGEEKIVLLKPISDNARGTNWVAGASGTTNLWNAVDNKPPVGVASGSATTTSQIRNATGDTTGNYDANLETYASKGIRPQDIVNAVQGVWELGCSSATATTGATRIVSNPAEGSETSISFSTGGIAGTSPTNWKRQGNTMIDRPAVNLLTSPVLRVGKRQNTTRVGMCDFMGLMVGFTQVTKASVTTQAVKRSATF